VNSLPKTVIRQRRGCDLNTGPSAPESSTLFTRLRYDRHFCRYDTIRCVELNGEDLSCHSRKTESVSLRKCPYDH